MLHFVSFDFQGFSLALEGLRRNTSNFFRDSIKIAEISTLPQSIVLEAKRLVTTWSETRSPDSEDDVSCGENKEKIKLAIHLIQLAQQDTLFDLEGLKEHLQNLQAQFKINTTPNPHSDI
ncbi:mutS-like protein 4 [Trichonephila clavipes]|uniref:MutS-like protein 4 n=1 Tax=Trichonephila clavipes TaxID=2585209 RepID=A0A8X6V1X4_TRICX|nr:mutS-like protein 4 [Trichonephila clavipes]